MSAARRSQRAGVISQPAERNGSDLVIPDQRKAEPSKGEAERHDGGNRDHQNDRNNLQDLVVDAVQWRHRFGREIRRLHKAAAKEGMPGAAARHYWISSGALRKTERLVDQRL